MRIIGSAARQLEIRRILDTSRVENQEMLTEMLAARGHRVTQTTVSRDLASLGAAKRADDSGWFYVIGSSGAAGSAVQEWVRVLREFAVSIEGSVNLVVVRTSPGGAAPVAAALDEAACPGVLGTIAGDDTVLIVTQRADGGSREAGRLRTAIAGR